MSSWILVGFIFHCATTGASKELNFMMVYILFLSLKQKKLQKLNIELPHDPAISLLGITQKNWKQELGYLHTHAHSCIIHNSQKVEATQGFTYKWLNEQNVAFIYKGLIRDLQKEGNSDTCCDTEEPWGHYTK